MLSTSNSLRPLPVNAVSGGIQANSSTPERRSRPLETTPESSNLSGYVEADSVLAGLYATALRDGIKNGILQESLDNIPKDSSFGKWWSHLHDAIKSPQFTEWAKSKHIDLSKPIEIYPGFDQISCYIHGERKSLWGPEQDKSWPVFMAPVMKAAGVLGLGKTAITAPTSGSSAPLETIGKFYGEPRRPWSMGTLAERATKLERTKIFEPIPPADLAKRAHERSDEALAHEQTALGDAQDKHVLGAKLRALPNDDPAQIARYLKDTLLQVHPLSSYSLNQEEQVSDTVSLEAFISGNGWQLPKSRVELNNLIEVLDIPPLQEPPHGDFGGGLSWSPPLDLESQTHVYSHVLYNLKLPGLDGGNSTVRKKGALDYLMKRMPLETYDLRNPRRVIEDVLGSPKALELGKALQEKMGAAVTEETFQDWALTAIMTTLDNESVFAPKQHHTAGFDLSADRLYGQPLAGVKQALSDHLVATGKTSARLAPIGTHLLLSRAAPELLVKDIPSSVTYGSNSWMHLRAAVKFIEAQAPGASAQMNFTQIMERANLTPLSSDEQALRNVFTNESLMLWGKLNSVIGNQAGDTPSLEDLKLCQTHFNQQVEELSKVSQHLMTPMPTRRDIALEKLKDVFGETLPLERNYLQSANEQYGDNRYFSPVDVYMSNELRPGRWRSIDSSLSANDLTSKGMTDPNFTFKTRFDAYHHDLKVSHKNLLKNMFSKLPEEDRKHLEFGKQELYYLRPAITGYASHLIPSADEIVAKGLGGLLIRSEHEGNVCHYEVFPNSMLIRKRTDLPRQLELGGVKPLVNTEINKTHRLDWNAYKTGKPPRAESTTSQIQLHRITPEKEWVPPPQDSSVNAMPMSYFGGKSEYLAELAASQHFTPDYETFKNAAHGESALEETTRQHIAGREFLLGLIPFKNAIEAAIDGDAAQAAMLFVMDGLSFVVPAGKVASNIGKIGTSGALKSLSIAKMAGAGILAAANPVGGLDDLVRLVGKGGQKLTVIGAQRFGKVMSITDNVDLVKLSNRHDIAMGTYKVAGSTEPVSVAAKYNDAAGKWLPYDVIKNRVYGKPLDNFTPETARYSNSAARRVNENHLERSLAKDNSINFGRNIKDFNSPGTGIFTYVDEYKGVERLNVCAHGIDPNAADLLLDEPMKIYYNGKNNTPAELLATLKASNINPESFNNVRLLMCDPASGSVDSFRQQFGGLIKREVKAFQGPLQANLSPDAINEISRSVPTNTAHLTGEQIKDEITRRLLPSLANHPKRAALPGDLLSGSQSSNVISFNAVSHRLNTLTNSAGSYDLLLAAKRFDASSLGTFKVNAELVEGPVVLQNGKWHRYNTVTGQAYGPAVRDFLPSARLNTEDLGKWTTADGTVKKVDEAVVNNWKRTVRTHREGPEKEAFESGYYSGNPETIKGFSNNMKAPDIMKLAGNRDLTARQVGMLVKKYDDVAYELGRNGSAKFIDVIEPRFGNVHPMPQVVYFSKTAQLSDGQCAALSRVMATAMEQGKEGQLIKNMFSAAAFPTDPASREFIGKLSKMQNQVGARSAFHAGQPVRELSVNDMVKELADATVSKSVMIDSPGHAMAAGVKIQDGSRSYYFYDPNFGLADFSSAEAMQKGLEKLTRDKKLKPQYKTHDTDPNKLTFKVFDHDDAWQQKNSVFSADVKKLYENPLALSGTTPLSNAELRKNWEILYQAPDNQQRICYESSVLIGQSEKTLSPEVFTAVIASTNGEGTNYSRRYLDLMDIKQDSLKATFNAEDITESGLINFKHTNQGGEFGHTVYIQKTKNDELFLFNINSPDLDVAMIRNGNPPEYSGGMSVFPLSNGKSKGLQDFLDGLGGKPGWQFAYTPASTLNANVKKLAP